MNRPSANSRRMILGIKRACGHLEGDLRKVALSLSTLEAGCRKKELSASSEVLGGPAVSCFVRKFTRRYAENAETSHRKAFSVVGDDSRRLAVLLRESC